MHRSILLVAAVPALATALVGLSGCGGGAPSPPAVSVRIAASADQVYVDQSIVLTWSSAHASACTASGAWSGTLAPSGTLDVAVATVGTNDYMLTCTGDGVADQASTQVTAIAPHFSLRETFAPRAGTIPTSEGAPSGVTDFWVGNDFARTNLGYGPTRVQRVSICLGGQVPIATCSDQPPVTGRLPTALLAAMDAGFARFVGSGDRLLVRFVYNMGPIGPGAIDAPADLIQTHIDQVAPILLKYQDLILALEAGFIGTWGEWHDSTSGNDNRAARQAVLDRELMHFRGHFPVLVRYPQMLLDYLGSATPSPDLGLHDDYFLSAPDDAGTWSSANVGTGSYAPAALQAFAAATSTTSMFVGEFGALAPALQTCANLDAYAHRFNLQSVSLDIYPASIGAALAAQGCAQAFLDKVGPRIEVQQALVLGGTAAGSDLHAELTLSNTGYGRVVRARPVAIVVLDGANVLATLPLALADLDLRTLSGGAPATTFRVDLPLAVDIGAAVSAGRLAIALQIPDPAPSLAARPAYALPLDSVDARGAPIFDPATGLNRLGLAVGQP